jgi:hypothetical protein
MSKDTTKMPPLVAIAGALGSAAVVRWAYRAVKRVNKELVRPVWPSRPLRKPRPSAAIPLPAPIDPFRSFAASRLLPSGAR